jgi:hypothetical protein
MNKADPPEIVAPAKENAHDENLQPKQRTLGLSVLLIFSFVYCGLLLLILIAGLLFPENVQNILQQYYRQTYISQVLSIAANVAAVLVFATSFYGLILLWKFKRRGFYYFASSQAAIILTVVFLLKSFDWINIAVMTIIILIIGINSKDMH